MHPCRTQHVLRIKKTDLGAEVEVVGQVSVDDVVQLLLQITLIAPQVLTKHLKTAVTTYTS